MAWFRRDNANKDNRYSVRDAYGGMQRLEDVRAKDVPERMNTLIPDFRFFYSGNREDAVLVTAYRKGIVFPFSVTLDDIRTLYGYDSVVPLSRKLMEKWTQYRDNLMAIMKDVGEPHGIWCLMDGLTMDNESGYLVSGLKEDKNAVGQEDKDDDGSI